MDNTTKSFHEAWREANRRAQAIWDAQEAQDRAEEIERVHRMGLSQRAADEFFQAYTKARRLRREARLAEQAEAERARARTRIQQEARRQAAAKEAAKEQARRAQEEAERVRWEAYQRWLQKKREEERDLQKLSLAWEDKLLDAEEIIPHQINYMMLADRRGEAALQRQAVAWTQQLVERAAGEDLPFSQMETIPTWWRD